MAQNPRPATSIPRDARIFVAGHRGLVGSAIVRRLEREGFTNLLTAGREQLDLRDQAAVNAWFRAQQPAYVFLVAGTVGGIMANATRPASADATTPTPGPAAPWSATPPANG